MALASRLEEDSGLRRGRRKPQRDAEIWAVLFREPSSGAAFPRGSFSLPRLIEGL